MSARAVPGASSNQMPHSAHCRNLAVALHCPGELQPERADQTVRHDVQAEPLALGIPEQTRRSAPFQLLVDRALDVVKGRFDEISRFKASEHAIAEMSAGDPRPLHPGRRLWQLPARDGGMAGDLHAAAVRLPMDHSLKSDDIAGARRLPDPTA